MDSPNSDNEDDPLPVLGENEPMTYMMTEKEKNVAISDSLLGEAEIPSNEKYTKGKLLDYKRLVKQLFKKFLKFFWVRNVLQLSERRKERVRMVQVKTFIFENYVKKFQFALYNAWFYIDSDKDSDKESDNDCEQPAKKNTKMSANKRRTLRTTNDGGPPKIGIVRFWVFKAGIKNEIEKLK